MLELAEQGVLECRGLYHSKSAFCHLSQWKTAEERTIARLGWEENTATPVRSATQLQHDHGGREIGVDRRIIAHLCAQRFATLTLVGRRLHVVGRRRASIIYRMP